MNQPPSPSLMVLLQFYSSRSEELTWKGTLSYAAWGSGGLAAILLFALHLSAKVGETSMYMMLFPPLLLVILSIQAYLIYKIRLLRVFLNETEAAIRVELKESHPKNPLPFWYLTQQEEIRPIGFGVEPVTVQRFLEYLVISGVWVAYLYCVARGMQFLLESPKMQVPGGSAALYATFFVGSLLGVSRVFIVLFRRRLGSLTGEKRVFSSQPIGPGGPRVG